MTKGVEMVSRVVAIVETKTVGLGGLVELGISSMKVLDGGVIGCGMAYWHVDKRDT